MTLRPATTSTRTAIFSSTASYVSICASLRLEAIEMKTAKGYHKGTKTYFFHVISQHSSASSITALLWNPHLKSDLAISATILPAGLPERRSFVLFYSPFLQFCLNGIGSGPQHWVRQRRGSSNRFISFVAWLGYPVRNAVASTDRCLCFTLYEPLCFHFLFVRLPSHCSVAGFPSAPPIWR